ncbi:MAG: hypothetical protein Greene07147_59 [Parcubacteria group bacterium Greene0714_7]|nr:MAG: hypothetical protein Greene07147_59 [Parcubacteria group bacterium Greene0714_7]
MKPNTVEKQLLKSVPEATGYSYTLLSNRKKRRDRYFIELRIVHEIELISEGRTRSSFQYRENVPQVTFV